MQITKNNSKRISRAKALMLVLLAAVLVGLLLFFLVKQRPLGPASTASDSNQYSPPTTQEQASGDKQKEAIVEKEQSANQSTPTSTAQITIVDANQYGSEVEVRAFVSNAIETDGLCTATFTKSGAKTVSQKVAASPDARTTQCSIILPRSEFQPAGSWELTFNYTSPKLTGYVNRAITIN